MGWALKPAPADGRIGHQTVEIWPKASVGDCFSIVIERKEGLVLRALRYFGLVTDPLIERRIMRVTKVDANSMAVDWEPVAIWEGDTCESL